MAYDVVHDVIGYRFHRLNEALSEHGRGRHSKEGAIVPIEEGMEGAIVPIEGDIAPRPDAAQGSLKEKLEVWSDCICYALLFIIFVIVIFYILGKGRR